MLIKSRILPFALAAVLCLTGCASSATPTSDYSSVIKEEVGNFLLGKDLLRCNVGYAIGGEGCHREIELMVFSSQRIVKKFREMTPDSEIAQLVEKTVAAMEPMANSGFADVCSDENKGNVDAKQQCQDARIEVAGHKNFVLQDVWDSLDAWQPYF